MNDRQLDLRIKNAMEKNTEEEIRALEEQWTSGHDRAFAPSTETDRKILAAIQRSRKKNPLKKAAAVLLMAGIGLGSLFAFHGDALAQIQSYVEAWFSDHTAIYFTQKEKIEKKDWEITYVPKGYKKKETRDLTNMMDVVYENKEGEQLYFDYASKEGAYTIGQDNEHGSIRKLRIGENEAILYESQDASFMNTLILDTEDYVFTLDGYLSADELIKMAESIREKK